MSYVTARRGVYSVGSFRLTCSCLLPECRAAEQSGVRICPDLQTSHLLRLRPPLRAAFSPIRPTTNQHPSSVGSGPRPHPPRPSRQPPDGNHPGGPQLRLFSGRRRPAGGVWKAGGRRSTLLRRSDGAACDKSQREGRDVPTAEAATGGQQGDAVLRTHLSAAVGWFLPGSDIFGFFV